MTVSNRTQQIESDIDQMINGLFTEIDQILEEKHRFQNLEGKNKQNISLEKTETPHPNYTTNWPDSSTEPFWHESSSLLMTTPDESVTVPNLGESYRPNHEPDQLPLWIRHLDKIVFSSSCSLFFGILFFLQKQEQLTEFQLTQLSDQIAFSQQQNSQDKNQPINTDPQFLTYMERAFVEINREKKQAQQQETQAIPSQQPAQPDQSTTVASSLPAMPPPPPATPQPAPTTTTQTPTKTPPSPPASNFTKANSSGQSKNSKKSPPPSPSTKKPTKASSSSSEANATPEKKSQLPGYTLVGLLELGEHSAALLEMNDTTQRVMLGETIPGSNWKLVSIANQKATFEKNSQQKSMSVGQKNK